MVEKQYSQDPVKYTSGTLEQHIQQILSKKEIDDIRGAFDLLDKDKNGFISKAEIRRVMEASGEFPSEEELNEMIRRMDVDGDGSVGFNDFIMEVTNSQNVYKDQDEELETLRKAFEMCDFSGSGYISVTDLMYLFKSIDEPVTLDELLELMAEADTNHDDKIDFDEFVASLKREEQNDRNDT